ncbi:MAG: polysaccharide biosynthesis protein, partial [Clostridiales bacterium]|nr:polysaccharide biosynthesis protein [Clostridiales bacterium]
MKPTARTSRMKKQKAANFVIQGSILAMAGILVRIIGMLYRMPLNDIIGKQGNGYYNSALNVYNILLIL